MVKINNFHALKIIVTLKIHIAKIAVLFDLNCRLIYWVGYSNIFNFCCILCTVTINEK